MAEEPCPIQRALDAVDEIRLTLATIDKRLSVLEELKRRDEAEQARSPVSPAEMKVAYQIAKWVVMTVAAVVITSMVVGSFALAKLLH
jgi:hypothetical protein